MNVGSSCILYPVCSFLPVFFLFKEITTGKITSGLFQIIYFRGFFKCVVGQGMLCFVNLFKVPFHSANILQEGFNHTMVNVGLHSHLELTQSWGLKPLKNIYRFFFAVRKSDKQMHWKVWYNNRLTGSHKSPLCKQIRMCSNQSGYSVKSRSHITTSQTLCKHIRINAGWTRLLETHIHPKCSCFAKLN